jgi:hypothetical protein
MLPLMVHWVLLVGGFRWCLDTVHKNKAADALVDQAKKASDIAKANAKAAVDFITNSNLPEDQINDTMSDIADLAQMFRAREAGKY